LRAAHRSQPHPRRILEHGVDSLANLIAFEVAEMNWNRRYAIKSYLLSTIWTPPVVALVLEQATFRLTSVKNFDFGWIPGFALNREGAIAGADYVIASTIAFLVFTFSSLLVAI
jgi:hypothetical protein